jgi:hypothetical protein
MVNKLRCALVQLSLLTQEMVFCGVSWWVIFLVFVNPLNNLQAAVAGEAQKINNARSNHGTASAPASGHNFEEYSPYARPSYPCNVYFGNTHLHTNYSADAYVLGNTTITPADAYRFARGEVVRSSTGQQARLRRPLDFLAVSDHAEYLGVGVYAHNKNTDLIASPLGKNTIGNSVPNDDAVASFRRAYAHSLGRYSEIRGGIQ